MSLIFIAASSVYERNSEQKLGTNEWIVFLISTNSGYCLRLSLFTITMEILISYLKSNPILNININYKIGFSMLACNRKVHMYVYIHIYVDLYTY
jgi:hypothetical protein